MSKTPSESYVPEFVGREEELSQIMTLDLNGPPVYIVYGVRGIGKTRLLEEAIERLRKAGPYRTSALTFYIDCDKLAKSPMPDTLLQSIIDQGSEHLSGSWRSAEQAAREIVSQLAHLALGGGVYLFFDTTEALQSQEEFWRWLESNLVGPLVSAPQVRFVFAGRIPAPWRSYEVRRALRYLSLEPLPEKEAALKLLENCLTVYNDQLDEATVQAVLPLLYEMSQGHPGLSEQLARAAAPLLPEWGQHPDKLERVLRTTIVAPFIQSDLYGDLEPPWPAILTWASVLDEFDAYTLEQYVHRLPVLSDQVSDVPGNFYNRGIAEMRNQHALVWRSEKGYALHGILREIVQRQFEKQQPKQFQQALQAAQDTYATFAESLPEGHPDTKRYQGKAARYRRQLGSRPKEHQQ